MKLRILALSAVLFAGTTFTHANIIGNTLTNDSDGVLACYTYGFTQTGQTDFQLSIDGVHHRFEPGDILGNIYTDTELDPSLTLNHSIDNDTGIDWTDYHVEITLNKSFTITAATVDSPWTYAITAPSLIGSSWIGSVDYYGPANPILAGGTLNFGYTMNFTGSVAFSEQLTPTSVPEPATFAVVLCGLAGLFILQRRLSV